MLVFTPYLSKAKTIPRFDRSKKISYSLILKEMGSYGWV
jgi:hypothetical protein